MDGGDQVGSVDSQCYILYNNYQELSGLNAQQKLIPRSLIHNILIIYLINHILTFCFYDNLSQYVAFSVGFPECPVRTACAHFFQIDILFLVWYITDTFGTNISCI